MRDSRDRKKLYGIKINPPVFPKTRRFSSTDDFPAARRSAIFLSLVSPAPSEFYHKGPDANNNNKHTAAMNDKGRKIIMLLPLFKFSEH